MDAHGAFHDQLRLHAGEIFSMPGIHAKGKLVGPMGRTWTPEALGLSMMGIGTASLILAIFQYRKSLKTFRKSGLEFSWSLYTLFCNSTLVAMLGLFAFMSVALGY